MKFFDPDHFFSLLALFVIFSHLYEILQTFAVYEDVSYDVTQIYRSRGQNQVAIKKIHRVYDYFISTLN